MIEDSQDEATLIKQRLDLMGVKYHHKAGLDKLKSLLNAELSDEVPEGLVEEDQGLDKKDLSDLETQLATKETAETKRLKSTGKIKVVNPNAKMSANQRREELRKEAMKLIRVRVVPMDPQLKDHSGCWGCASNAFAEVRKFVQFNVPWYVPKIVYNALKEQQYQAFRKVKTAKGVDRKAFLNPKFNIQILPDISMEEVKEIQNAQLARGEGE